MHEVDEEKAELKDQLAAARAQMDTQQAQFDEIARQRDAERARADAAEKRAAEADEKWSAKWDEHCQRHDEKLRRAMDEARALVTQLEDDRDRQRAARVAAEARVHHNADDCTKAVAATAREQSPGQTDDQILAATVAGSALLVDELRDASAARVKAEGELSSLRGRVAAAEHNAAQTASALVCVGHDYMRQSHLDGCETCRHLNRALALAPAPAQHHVGDAGTTHYDDDDCPTAPAREHGGGDGK